MQWPNLTLRLHLLGRSRESTQASRAPYSDGEHRSVVCCVSCVPHECVCTEQGLLLTVATPLLRTTRNRHYCGARQYLLLSTAVVGYLVALRATRRPVAGRSCEAGRCFTRFKDGATNALLEASIAMQDAAKAAVEDRILTTKRSTSVTRLGYVSVALASSWRSNAGRRGRGNGICAGGDCLDQEAKKTFHIID